MRQRAVVRMVMLVLGLALIGWRMAGAPTPGGSQGQDAATAGSVAAELQRATSGLRGSGGRGGAGIHPVAQSEPEQTGPAPVAVTVVRGR